LIRLFNVYYPIRSLLLVGGEMLVVSASFLAAVLIHYGQDSYLVLNYENGFFKILGVTVLAILSFYYSDLYDLQRVRTRGETIVRILFTLGGVSLLLAVLTYVFPGMLVGQGVLTTGLIVLTVMVTLWRGAYEWLLRKQFLREQVYILGAGERASRLVEILRTRPELGMDVVGWAGALGNGTMTREALGQKLLELASHRRVDRVIVALTDRRSTMPVRELLELRLMNVKIEEASGLLEKISGKIDVDNIYPSWLIFSDGFQLNAAFVLVRRAISVMVSLACLLVVLPIIPLVILAIKATSPGPALYRQKRVGRNGQVFHCYKFRTMRPDAEADRGPTWADDDDPRITPVGRWLRKTRLDEIPQLWNVLKGDMGFVGPRPERPEFVEWLTREIPYYHLRHIVRPGITGWAQIRYHYGSSLEESKEKLRYDLYYIKNMSPLLDIYIILQTVKTVVLGRGSR
jgi:sugar transferase (PEP-CTERM system associated)